MYFLSAKDWISSAWLLSQESCISLSLVWTVLHIFEFAAFLDTKLVSLRCALCFWCFSSRAPWISSSFSSNKSLCLRDTGPRKSIAGVDGVSEDCQVLFWNGVQLHLIDCRYHWRSLASCCLVLAWRHPISLALSCLVVAVQAECAGSVCWQQACDLSSCLHHT